jgi:CubicO group peptidase (beta-lactamase class C family)
VDDLSSRIQQARDWVLSWQQSRRIPGVALVVSDRNQTLLIELSGLADRAGPRPVAPEQRWQIGSISKAFTAITVLQLQAEGRLTVHDRVTEHLTWVSPHLHPEITLHHLMCHTSGLTLGSEWTPDSLLESAVQGTVGRPQPPGGQFHYSNPGYELLGDVVEAVSGQLLEDRLEAAVLRPMGMHDSRASVTGADHDRDVRGHRPPRDDVLWTGQSEQAPAAFFPTCTADGAIAATPSDLATYLRFLLNEGADGVLSRDDFAQLAQRRVEDGEDWYGYGLRITADDGRTTIGHSGGMVGMFADVRVDPAAGLGAGLMINGFGDVTDANAHVLDLVCGLPSEPPASPRRPPTSIDAAPGDPFVGLYRSYNPWGPAFRVVASDQGLLLVDPVVGTTTVLHPDGDATFRPARPDSPEVAEFGVLAAGRYQRLELSGCGYGRARRD